MKYPGIGHRWYGTILSQAFFAVLSFTLATAIAAEQPVFSDGFETLIIEICDNDTDDDGDNYVDCDDFDCIGVNPCGPEQCDNGTDDDGDLYVDCDDFDCTGVNPCGPEQCDNGIDDDGDLYVDCDDFDCTGDPACPG